MSCDTGSYYFLFSFHFKKLPYLLIGRGEGKERGWGVKQISKKKTMRLSKEERKDVAIFSNQESGSNEGFKLLCIFAQF